MPEKLMRCYNSVKSSLRSRHPNWTPKRVDKVARAICVSRTGQTFTKHESDLNFARVTFNESDDMMKLGFVAPTDIRVIDFDEATQILEARNKTREKVIELPNDPNAVYVYGTAIYETTSANLHRYEAKELIKAVNTLVGVPCQKDHSNSMKDTFGIVIDAWHEKSADKPGTLDYVAMLDGDDPDTQRVRKGYVKGVSVAGDAEEVFCSICGEPFTWNHEHYIGEEYDKKRCEAILKGLTFAHLGYTPFPAVEDANTHYAPMSLGEAIDNALVYAESMRIDKITQEAMKGQEQIPYTNSKFGETKMPEDKQPNLVEFERLKYQLEEATKKNEELAKEVSKQETLEKQLKEAKQREMIRLVNEVAETEMALGRIEESKLSLRKTELEQSSVEVLEAKMEVLKSFLHEKEKIQEQSTPKSKTVISHDKFSEISEERKQFYVTEAKKETISMVLFGRRPTAKAVGTLNEWDSEMGRWKNDFGEFVQKVPKGGVSR